MKLFRFLITIVFIVGLGMIFVTTKPSEYEFAKWYVEKNQTGLGGFFDNAFVKIVEQRTETRDFLVFAVFELDQEECYIGVAGQIFGRGSVEQAGRTLENLIEQAK